MTSMYGVILRYPSNKHKPSNSAMQWYCYLPPNVLPKLASYPKLTLLLQKKGNIQVTKTFQGNEQQSRNDNGLKKNRDKVISVIKAYRCTLEL